MFVAIDYGRPGGDCTVKCTSRLKTDGGIEVISMERLETPEEGEPCSHRGCLNHITHPCEGCGRIAGRNKPDLMYETVEE
jgi:hypothetical protein